MVEAADVFHFAVCLALLPFLVFQGVWFAVALALNVLLCPCGSNWRTLQFLLFVPCTSVVAIFEGAH